MLMCNFTEYNSNCFATTGSLSFYSKGEATNFGNDIVNTDDFKSFKYKAKLLENTEVVGPNRILRNSCSAIKVSK